MASRCWIEEFANLGRQGTVFDCTALDGRATFLASTVISHNCSACLAFDIAVL
jgi:hypothetical protein